MKIWCSVEQRHIDRKSTWPRVRKKKCFTLKAMFDQDILKKYYVGHENCYGYTSEDCLI